MPYSRTLSWQFRPSWAVAALALAAGAQPAAAQERAARLPPGAVSGRIAMDGGMPVVGATVNVPRLRRIAVTDAQGRYTLDAVAPGSYEIFAQRGNARSDRRRITVATGDTVRVDFVLAIAHTLEDITVTASPRGQSTALESFGAVTSVSGRELAERMSGTLGETLEDQPGVAKRSFGPGSSRPIVRGFDGDRVLVMNDGLRSGDVSSQSGDHGVLTDPASVKRVEVLKGPATLLYGSNAIGGVVNAITYHDFTHEPPPVGVTGYATLDAGSADERVGGNFEVQYGSGGWVAWGGGGARRSGDYDTPAGTVPNSAADMRRAAVGAGRHGERGFLDASIEVNGGRYGVPFAADFEGGEEGESVGEGEAGEEAIEIDADRTSFRVNAGLRDLGGVLRDAHAHVTYVDWSHRELEGEEVGTRFSNETLVFRAQANHRETGPLAGTLGFWGQLRDFESVGAEALSPPVDQRSFAVFALEEIDFETLSLAVGLRLGTTSYDVQGAPNRDFTGLSGSLGLNVPLADGAALYTNLTRSHRAPALEELYNNGPHIGNLTFEIGNPDLVSESSLGIDAGVRLQSEQFSIEAGGYLYDLSDYVFLMPTGEVEDGLPEGEYAQADARYAGFEVTADAKVTERLRLLGGADFVHAELTTTGEPLPRIPPFSARLAADVHVAGLDIRPEVVFTAEQDRTFGPETPTDGYTLLNLGASYTIVSGDQQHMFSLRVYNITDELYRNHSSFIKDLAPEVGRGVQLTYGLRLF